MNVVRNLDIQMALSLRIWAVHAGSSLTRSKTPKRAIAMRTNGAITMRTKDNSFAQIKI